jgi:hypothetical protein
MDITGSGDVSYAEFKTWWAKVQDPDSGVGGQFASMVAEVPEEPPDAGIMVYCGICCLVPLGLYALKAKGPVEELFEQGQYVKSIDAAKRASHVRRCNARSDHGAPPVCAAAVCAVLVLTLGCGLVQNID